MLRLNGNRVFGLRNKPVLHTVVHLVNFNKTNMLNKYPVFMAEKLLVDNCDREFVNKFLNRKTFPEVKELYLSFDFEKGKYLEGISQKFDKVFLVNNSCVNVRDKKIKLITPYDFSREINRYPVFME